MFSVVKSKETEQVYTITKWPTIHFIVTTGPMVTRLFFFVVCVLSDISHGRRISMGWKSWLGSNEVAK